MVATQLRAMDAEAPSAMRTLRAFVVEDSLVIRENLIATLEEMAPVHVVGMAADEAAAVQMLTDAAHPVDIAVIDMFLAQGSGMGVLAAIRDAGVTVECVVLTNYATDDMRRHCLALGAARVFDKSGDIDALVEHCRQKSSATGVAAVVADAAGVAGTPG